MRQSSVPTAFEQHREAVRGRLRAAGLTRSGPGSISWTINREIVVVAGWGRAILLQLAHPLVAAGVGDHSGFRGGLRPGMSRLRSTIGAMLALTFGDDEEAIAVAAHVNAVHDRVFGQLRDAAGAFPAGEPYSAHQADLLRWVHGTLIESIPLTYELLVGPLTADERNRYCAEAAVIEPLFDIPAGTLPRTTVALDAFMRDSLRSRRIAVTPATRALARAALFPPHWRLLWPALRPAQLITIGLLPAAVRDAYGFSWTERDARALTRWTSALRITRRLLPPSVREWPAARHGPRRSVRPVEGAIAVRQLGETPVSR